MSVPAYPSYRDSGVEWLGEIPSHWTVKAIKRLSPVLRGASPRPIDDAKYFDDEGEYCWVRIADVSASDGKLRSTPQRLSDLGSSLSVKLEPDSLFVSIAGTVGKPCVTAVKACIHDGFVYFPRLGHEARFLYRIFEGGNCYAGLGKMGTQLNLNTDTVGGIMIALPDPEEMSAISAFLDRETAKIDGLVEEQRRLVELLKEKRQAVISHAVTKGLDPSALMKDSGVEWLGEVPAHWKATRLSAVASFFQGKAHEPFFDADGEHVCVTARFISTNGAAAKMSSENLSPATPGDILMVMSDLPNGRALARSYLVQDSRSYAVNQRVCCVGVREGNPAFFSYQLNRNKQLLQFNDGVEQTHLKNSAFTKLVLAVPPPHEQDQIADFLSRELEALDQLSAEAEAAITLLQERRSALISAAVTGKIDVRGLVPTPSQVEAA